MSEVSDAKGKIISIVNQKGGVGKSFTTIHLAAALRASKKKVAIVDLDPQANATDYGNRDEIYPDNDATKAAHATNLFKYSSDQQNGVSHGVECQMGFDVYPATAELVMIQKGSDMEQMWNFKEALSELREIYDYIIVDCPPTDGNLQTASFMSADYVIVPTNLELDSYNGAFKALTAIKKAKSKYNPGLSLLGVQVNHGTKTLDINANHYKNKLDAIDGARVFSERWYIYTVMKQARTMGMTAFEYEPNAKDVEKKNVICSQINSTVKEILAITG